MYKKLKFINIYKYVLIKIYNQSKMTSHIVYFRDNNFIIEIMTNEILPI